MSKQVKAMTVNKDQKVLVEVYETADDLERVSIGGKAADAFEAAWDSVQPVIHALANVRITNGAIHLQYNPLGAEAALNGPACGAATHVC